MGNFIQSTSQHLSCGTDYIFGWEQFCFQNAKERFDKIVRWCNNRYLICVYGIIQFHLWNKELILDTSFGEHNMRMATFF